MRLNIATIELAAFFAEDAEHSDEVLNPVIPNIYDMFWALIFFVALWALLRHVLLPPIMAGRNERNAKALAARDATSGAENDLQAIRAEHNEKLASARAEAGRITDEARAEVDADRQAKVSAVEAEVAEKRAAALSEIEAARLSALAGARGDVDSLAVNAAGAVLGKNLDVGANRSVLDSVLNEVI